MSYFPPPSPGTEFTKRYQVEGDDPVAVAVGDIEAAPKLLLKLQLTAPPGMIAPAIWWPQGVVQAELQRLVGVNALIFNVERSINDIAWSSMMGVSSVGGALSLQQNAPGQQFGVDGDLFIRVAMYNGDGATSGIIQNYKAYFEILLPVGYTVERLI